MNAIRVVLSTIGKFHTFDLARQLHARQALTAIYTGYPRFKLQNEELPVALVRSFPWLQTIYMSQGRMGLTNQWLSAELAWASNQMLDRYTARTMPECDIFMALSNTGLISGRVAREKGARYLCDRACSHIRYQDTILREEYALHKLPFRGIDPRIIEKEEREYALADGITVGSNYVKRSFLEMSIQESKIHQIPYGVDLSRFYPDGKPSPENFDVLFAGSASVRKGVPYLLESFVRLKHPNKRLTFVGTVQPEIAPIIRRYAENHPISCLGHQPQTELKKIMSRSHVMVLPSIDEGLAMVQAQAMACGCPIIGSLHSGAEDLITDKVEGFIVPIRDVDAITTKLELLAQCPDVQVKMSTNALKRVQTIGGWNTYGTLMYQLFADLLEFGPV